MMFVPLEAIPRLRTDSNLRRAIDAEVQHQPPETGARERRVLAAAIRDAAVDHSGLYMVRIEGSTTCGVAGCSSFIYEQAANDTVRRVFEVTAGTIGPTYALECPNEIAIILPGGGGMSSNWGKWSFDGNTFLHQENHADLSSLSVCH